MLVYLDIARNIRKR